MTFQFDTSGEVAPTTSNPALRLSRGPPLTPYLGDDGKIHIKES